jgi:thiamine biosynthesis protein ThiS
VQANVSSIALERCRSYLRAKKMTVDHTVQVCINGEHRRVAEGISISELVSELGFDPVRVAVERNLEVVPRSTLGDVKVQDGDDFEIVRFVGGG